MIKKGNLYYPSEEFKKKANFNDEKIYDEAEKDSVLFWEKIAQDLFWQKKWDKTFEHKPPFFKWFLNGKLNITENILEKNIEKSEDKDAIIWEPESPTEETRKITYKELLEEVSRFANALKKLGVKKGDRIGIYMPMIPEIIISMLACARIGAVHLVVFSAFSPAALKMRLDAVQAKLLITADGYYRRGQIMNLKKNADEGSMGTSVEKTIIVKRAGNEIIFNSEKDLWWDDLIKRESGECKAEVMDSEDLFFILPESGTTGQFLPIYHTTGGYMVQAFWTGKAVLDFKKEDVLWCMSDAGWVTGHTYTIYSPLLNGLTTVIYEGAPDWPGPDRWAQIIKEHGITIFYTAPTAIRMFMKYGTDVIRNYKFENLRLLGSVGEPIDESSWIWYFQEVGKEKCPIVDTYWQTETGGIIISSLPGIGPIRPCFTGRALPGVNIDILGEEGKKCAINQEGNIVILPPYCPGLLRGIYGGENKYIETYWSRYNNKTYFASDSAFIDENKLIRIVGRVDDIIKVAGHRVSTGEMENVINNHQDVIESVVIGAPDQIKGEVPIVFAIAKSDKTDDDLKKELMDYMKKEFGPISLPEEIYLVPDLPKTRSGKITRNIIKKIYLGEELGDLSVLSNPGTIEKIKEMINPVK